MKRIGILTQPLHNNYGGLLQAYALQKVLKDSGHEVLTVNLPFRKTFYSDLKGTAVRGVKKFALGKKQLNLLPNRPNREEHKVISQHTGRFLKEHIEVTEEIALVENLARLKKYNFDAYIVGSDQVWRPKYSPGIPSFFLEFLGNDEKIKRVSYAASFGTDAWEYDEQLTRLCRNLAQKFDAVSVREDSAVELCRKHFGVTAEHLPDPTLLLKKEDYIELIEKDNIRKKKNTLMLYVLDKSPEKRALSEAIRKKLSLETNSVMPEKIFKDREHSSIEQCTYPPVTEWLRGFMDAEFVITDSFHGTIFSILFNKPFLSIANDARGVARFTSLLKTFGLEERLITSQDNLNYDQLLRSIDYKPVQQKIEEERKKALDFLTQNLSA